MGIIKAIFMIAMYIIQKGSSELKQLLKKVKLFFIIASE